MTYGSLGDIYPNSFSMDDALLEIQGLVLCICDNCGHECEGIPGTECATEGCGGELIET
ncbi:MAG: hypothetical protein ABH837_01630 [bacterium]